MQNIRSLAKNIQQKSTEETPLGASWGSQKRVPGRVESPLWMGVQVKEQIAAARDDIIKLDTISNRK